MAFSFRLIIERDVNSSLECHFSSITCLYNLVGFVEFSFFLVIIVNVFKSAINL